MKARFFSRWADSRLRARLAVLPSLLALQACAQGNQEDFADVRGDAKIELGTDTADKPDTTKEEEETGFEDTGVGPDTSVVDSGSLDAPGDAPPADTAKDSAVDTAPVEAGPSCGTEEREPNESESNPVDKGSITDCDGAENTVKGVLSSGRDVDVWKFKGTDSFGCTVDPTIKLSAGLGSVKLCAFLQCTTGTSTTFNKCTKGVKAKSPDGRDGCCADSGGNIAIDFSCPAFGTDDGAEVYMVVSDPAESATCKDYAITYHF